MSFFDVFFPEQAQAAHLRSIAEQSRHSRRRASRSAADIKSLESRIDELESDLGFVSLLLASVMGQLEERGSLSRDDLRELMREFDDADGKDDQRLDINVLRGLTK